MTLLPKAALALLASLLAAGPAAGATPGEAEGRAAPAAAEDLSALLEPIRAAHGLPALAAAVLRSGRVTALGAVGVRKRGSTEAVTTADLWHLGSNTKSMTATLLARLVERGKLSWDLTLEKAFPGMELHPDYRHVTLEQLLTHRGGAPGDLAQAPAWQGLWRELWRRQGSPTEQRMQLAAAVLAKPPEAPPGRSYLYSNAGYAVAGAIAEQRLGLPWEELMGRELFTPLGMASAGFGAPGTPGLLDQPWGHGPGGPAAPGPQADNPPAIGPAGTVHASLADWAKYALLHLDGARGRARILTPESFRRLHTPPPGQEYAMGWLRVERGWARGHALTHAGSNTMWYAVVWLAPGRDLGLLVAANQGGEAAARACDEAAGALIRRTTD